MSPLRSACCSIPTDTLQIYQSTGYTGVQNRSKNHPSEGAWHPHAGILVELAKLRALVTLELLEGGVVDCFIHLVRLIALFEFLRKTLKLRSSRGI